MPILYGNSIEELRACASCGLKAYYLLGILYAKGIGGVEQDYSKAAEYMRIAAEGGYIRAMVYLSEFHQLGLGVPQDMTKAEALCRKAAELGDKVAKFIVNQYYYTATWDHLPRVYPRDGVVLANVIR